MIVAYGPQQIHRIWGRVLPFIERAIARGSAHTPDSIYADLLGGRMQLWTYQKGYIRAVVTTGIRGRECYIVTAGGDSMREWIDSFPIIERWAIMEGCDALVIHGRKGWSKLLKFKIVGKDELGHYIQRKELWPQAHRINQEAAHSVESAA